MTQPDPPAAGLSLAPLRGLRPAADGARLAARLCPPYDVIDPGRRAELLASDPYNAVGLVLPEPTDAGYAGAADLLADWAADGELALDDEPVLYVYEMADAEGHRTRGLLGAVALHAPEDGVILPHENTMAGPVADRLAVMTATGSDLEPIYLVYDGGGEASQVVRAAGERPPAVTATTDDGITHRLWLLRERRVVDAVQRDLSARRALIADGHHRYATYRERQRAQRAAHGAGPWDRGLALVVDATEYGPQVHAIHRVVSGLSCRDALDRAGQHLHVQPVASVAAGLAMLADAGQFTVVVTDDDQTAVVSDLDGWLTAAVAERVSPPELAALDVTLVHRGLVEQVWGLADDEQTVGYAHDVDEALRGAAHGAGCAVLLRPTPVADVARVAAVGARMPRKSTLFTPKPASGLVLRRLADQPSD